MQQDSAIRKKLTRECYQSDDEKDSIGRVLTAFKQSQQLKPVFSRLTEARRKNVLMKGADFATVLDDALAKGVITEDEKTALLAFEASRIDALDVDEFPQ